jgi:hypothetical protein
MSGMMWVVAGEKREEKGGYSLTSFSEIVPFACDAS